MKTISENNPKIKQMKDVASRKPELKKEIDKKIKSITGSKDVLK